MPKCKDSTETGSLHQLTLELLKSAEETTFDVAVATGLSYSWVVAFASNRMQNPSVNRVQHLYEYLTGKHLKLAR